MSGIDQCEGAGGGTEGGDDHRRFIPPTCFRCHEPGHYANQCPNRGSRHYSDRPSASSEKRRSRLSRCHYSQRRQFSFGRDEDVRSAVSKLNKSVAFMKEFYDEKRLKKEEKARQKLEKKEAEERELAEREKLKARRMKAEMKAKRKAKEARLAAEMEKERRAKMKKDLDIHMAVRMSVMEENFFERFEHTLAPLRQVLRNKGKQKVSYKSVSESTSASSDGESDTNVTQELNVHMRHLYPGKMATGDETGGRGSEGGQDVGGSVVQNEGGQKDTESTNLDGTKGNRKELSLGESSGKAEGSKRGSQETRDGRDKEGPGPQISDGVVSKKVRITDAQRKLVEIEKRILEYKARLMKEMMIRSEEDLPGVGLFDEWRTSRG
ncbi:hypothetical protein CBR_g4707 [Chara braunii]|uniref:CCHC-type domain-containing protein n=1 Tax=Chara braunii TaxID=69332 RepID=A0A388KIK2_CHABU|nr:hypothetical protein CBR_g4707 [Chara braunii]|eukprot:GBG69880.1 hypothetical protein CBR_g4707 [Chara braunii]